MITMNGSILSFLDAGFAEVDKQLWNLGSERWNFAQSISNIVWLNQRLFIWCFYVNVLFHKRAINTLPCLTTIHVFLALCTSLAFQLRLSRMCCSDGYRCGINMNYGWFICLPSMIFIHRNWVRPTDWTIDVFEVYWAVEMISDCCYSVHGTVKQLQWASGCSVDAYLDLTRLSS